MGSEMCIRDRSMIMLQESVVEFKKESLLKERPNLQYE